MAARRSNDAGPDADLSVDTAIDTGAEGLAPPGASGRAYLVCHGEGGVQVVGLEDGASITLGRAPDADVRIDSPRVSRYHARVSRAGDELTVADLGSRNGTRVNRRVLRSGETRAHGGDVIKVGPLEAIVARAAPVAAAEDADEEEEDGPVVADRAMVALFATLRRIAPSPSPVLILGETGTGKEVVAERIHRLGPRANGPFVRLNCASLPDALLESELFGHERGAFTGADKARVGYFEAAHGGTLLLDEIGEMPLALQAKLLRVLEQGRVARLGATAQRPIDVRVLCATHRDLEEEVRQGRFRQDLFYRVSTFTLRVPPLRERPVEIKLLVELMARRIAARTGLSRPTITPAASARLLAHAWPGNVRELRNAMEHAVVMADGAPIAPEHLPGSIGGSEATAVPAIRTRMEDLERAAILAALAAEGDNRTHAARRLGISRRTLIYKMIKYGLRG
jgi:DNA-binding NtrC family response regulator